MPFTRRNQASLSVFFSNALHSFQAKNDTTRLQEDKTLSEDNSFWSNTYGYHKPEFSAIPPSSGELLPMQWPLGQLELTTNNYTAVFPGRC